MNPRLKCKASAVLVLSLLLAGCSMLRKGNSNTSSEGIGKPPGSTRTTAFKPSDDERKDLGDAMRKLKTAYPYRLTEISSATMNGQQAMPENQRVVDFAAADRSHLKWTGGTGSDLEEITIGEKQYWYSDGKWTESAGKSAAERARMGRKMEELLAAAVKEVQYVGAETVNGASCFAYTYTMEINTSGQNYTGTGKAWVGAADGLVHQNDSEFKVSGYTQKSHIVYEYNVDVKVEKPVP